MTRIVRQSVSEEYTRALARGLGDVLLPGDVVLLSGELGSGKTTFTRALAVSLGVDARLVSSPTFVMLNIYPAGGARAGLAVVGHLDAYRLHGADDLESLGIDAVLDPTGGRARGDAVLIVEWPERLAGWVPEPSACARVRLDQTGATARRVEFELPEAWSTRPALAAFAEREPIACRTTGAMVSPTARTYPFADEKARDADLYKWFSGEYRISRPATGRDFDAEP